MDLDNFLARLGLEIEDPEEETFLLFSQDIPSQNLGFVDAHAATLDLTLADKDYVIHQSPTVLTSNREGGTTGAVVWKITPLVAEYLASQDNLFWASGAFSPTASLLELGCGISGLVGLALAPSVGRYILTDQSYVARFVDKNLDENRALWAPSASSTKGRHPNSSSSSSSQRQQRRGTSKTSSAAAPPRSANLRFTPLDWETDEVTPALTGDEAVRSFDVVLACDCIYNEALIDPLVQACADACKLRSKEQLEHTTAATAANDGGDDGEALRPTICLVAQQLRDPEIFEAWMKAFHRQFRSWRLPEEVLSDALRSNPGFAIHVGVLRN